MLLAESLKQVLAFQFGDRVRADGIGAVLFGSGLIGFGRVHGGGTRKYKLVDPVLSTGFKDVEGALYVGVVAIVESLEALGYRGEGG